MTPMAMPLVGMLSCSTIITGFSVGEVERGSVVSLVATGPESELNGNNIFDSVLVSGVIPDPSSLSLTTVYNN